MSQPVTDSTAERRLEFARNVRWFREQRGLTVADLARAAKISYVTAKRLEYAGREIPKGYANPTLQTMCNVADALGTSLQRLVGLVGALVLLLGCAPNDTLGPRGELAVSLAWTPAQTEAVLAAVNEWRIATDGAVDLGVRMGAPGPGTEATIAPVERYEDPGIAGRAVLAPDEPVRITAVQTLTGAELQRVITHELGHALGLPHLERGIMCPAGAGEGLSPQIDRAMLRAYFNGRGPTPTGYWQRSEGEPCRNEIP